MFKTMRLKIFYELLINFISLNFTIIRNFFDETSILASCIYLFKSIVSMHFIFFCFNHLFVCLGGPRPAYEPRRPNPHREKFIPHRFHVSSRSAIISTNYPRRCRRYHGVWSHDFKDSGALGVTSHDLIGVHRSVIKSDPPSPAKRIS